MGFFEEIDTMSILEKNSAKLSGLQMQQAAKMLRQYRAARDELKIQLLSTASNTFTEAKLKNALVQIDAGIAQLSKQTHTTMYDSFDYLSSEGIDDAAREMNAFEKKFEGVTTPLNMDSVLESINPDNYLFNNYRSSVEAYDSSIRSQFEDTLTQSLLQNKTWTQAVYDMESVFDAEEWRLARIVRTELHGIYNISKNKSFLGIRDEYIPDLMKTLYHPMDSRTGNDSEYAASLGLIVPIDESFHYSWKGKQRVFFTPPDRPHDRAILIPYRKKYSIN